MGFPRKNDAAPAAEKPARKFKEDGTMVGCVRAGEVREIELDGRTVEVDIQVSTMNKAGLARVARAALSRPDGVKEVSGGLFRVVARPKK
jgi:hypothetical protein